MDWGNSRDLSAAKITSFVAVSRNGIRIERASFPPIYHCDLDGKAGQKNVGGKKDFPKSPSAAKLC
jgi:hypothetical protein